jgi:hypothetical protein
VKIAPPWTGASNVAESTENVLLRREHERTRVRLAFLTLQ